MSVIIEDITDRPEASSEEGSPGDAASPGPTVAQHDLAANPAQDGQDGTAAEREQIKARIA